MRTWLMWSLFVAGLVLTGGLMAFVNVRLLELEEAQEQATRDAIASENVRLAMWQMDSELAPLVTDEATRPYFQYLSFYPAEGAYTRMFREIDKGDVLMPSPLLIEDKAQIVLHFQFDPDGELTSPQLPQGNKRDLAEARYLSPDQIAEAEQRLATVADTVTRAELLSRLPERKLDLRDPVIADMVYANDYWQSQNSMNQAEYNKRSQATKKAAVQRKVDQYEQVAMDNIDPVDIAEGPMTAVWIGESLFLARRISLDGEEYVQGCLLDWSRVREDLVGVSRELVPNAEFRPAVGFEQVEASNVHRLASLPVEVTPGEVPVEAPESGSPLRISMYIAWACLALVAFGMAFVLHRTLSLAQRRAEFVSAVSHELRTPLTTFRMYTEMLTGGMVKEESTRDEYLKTLHSESLRLGHLVENVLAYARLENSSATDRVEELPLTRLLERATERLKARTEQAKMEMVVEPCDADITVKADAGAVEQIVFNLVDNACKYAASAEDKRIHLSCSVTNGDAEIRVRDHGPGIQREEGTRLFKPFRKSAQAAAESAPGVGLGLTLSRRLARAMHGDLQLDSSVKDGCCFVLSLPRA